MIRFPRILILLLLPLLLLGCSSLNLDKVLPDKQVEYKREVIADKQLEVPPDLTSSRIDNRVPGLTGGGAASYSDYASTRGGDSAAVISRGTREVLPEVPDIKVLRDGRDRWLVIKGPAEEVWDKVVDFWQENGILLEEMDPQAGFMETSWLENRADIPNDAITDFIRGIFEGAYGAATRDRFRIRLEEGEQPGTTELYLTHFGMEQDFATGTTNEEDQIFWKIRPRDPGLEEIMLRRIMVFMGLAEQQAKAELAAARELKGVRSRLEKGEDQLDLLVEEPFDRAWRTVGLALDRVGFVVEDRDRSRGNYYVRYKDPTAGSGDKGWLSKLAFWRSDEPAAEGRLYQVHLESAGEGTRVSVQDEEGGLLTGDTAQRILVLVQEQLK
jgi:outer membrane protein assembly factor BamC